MAVGHFEVGIGVDFTSCTVLPIDKTGTPLCFDKKYEHRLHSHAKHWNHHSTQHEADRFNELANGRGDPFIKRYGGKMSSEWVVPKAMQILHADENIYYAMDRLMEGCDWTVLQLTGEEQRSLCQAGYKVCWSKKMDIRQMIFSRHLIPECNIS